MLGLTGNHGDLCSPKIHSMVSFRSLTERRLWSIAEVLARRLVKAGGLHHRDQRQAA